MGATGILVEADSIHYYFHLVVGLNDLATSEGDVFIYPNPSNGKFIVSSRGNINSIEVFNMVGESIYVDKTANHRKLVQVDLQKKTKGVFLVKIEDRLMSRTIKVLFR